MKYCKSCVLPDTRPNIKLDEDGVCNACRSHSTKVVIDWEARNKAFLKVVENAKARSEGYDCLIPVSGGKDSTWQTLVCLERGLKPLAVTWRPPSRTPIGQRNLDNLVSLGVDHIDYQISPTVEKKFLIAALERFGSPAVPMHMAIFNIPVSIAVKFKIPLIIWGENSAFEYGSDSDRETGFKLDREWFEKYGVTHGTHAEDWISENLTRKELTPYFGPTPEELEASGVLAVFLGFYFQWDPEMTMKAATEHGFRSSDEGPKTGYYDYADIDDDFISIHHYLKWHKFGFTRLFDNLSLEIRNGRITRDQAVEIIASASDQEPVDDIAAFCRFTEISTSRFYEIIEKFRNHDIWVKENGTWKIKDFLIPDWRWK